MGYSAGFWNRLARRYARTPIADEASYQKKLDITRQYFRPEMNVLELGCGTGSTALVHAPYVQHIRALDYSSEMITIAEEKAQAAGVSNVTFEQAGVDELALPDNSVDAVLALNLLHLLKDKEQTIRQVYRMLKPGGIFVSSTVCISDAMPWFRWVAPLLGATGLLPTVQCFSAAALQDSMRQSGFDIEHAWQPSRKKALFVVARKPQ